MLCISKSPLAIGGNARSNSAATPRPLEYPCTTGASVSIVEIDIHSVHRWLQNGTDENGQAIALVDCREQSEYDTAKIETSILMPMGQWPPTAESLASLNGKRVVVHCHHGGRSLRVANWFRQNGHPEATSMSGGIDQWSLEIDPQIARY